MRALFLPLITRGAAIGTITRCLSIADHLKLSGHESCFLTNGEGAKLVSEAGYPWMEGRIPDPPGRHRPLYDLSDVAVHLNLTKEDYIRSALQHEQQAIQEFRPDVLFSEFKLTAPITAAETGLPLVSTACSPADPRFKSPLFSGDKSVDHEEAVSCFNRVLEARQMEPINDVAELFFTRSHVKIAPTIPQLEPLLSDVPNLHYVGYLLYDKMELAPLPPGLIEQIQDRATLFVYFSFGEIEPAKYIRVIPEAFDQSEFHAVVAVGDHPDVKELPESTANVTYVRFVPGRSMLQRCKALIFHGGQNTAMAALIHKLPSLIYPGKDFERDFNARSLANVGAAIHAAVENFSPEKTLELTRKLLSSSIHHTAETLSSEILSKGGPRHAADLVMKAADKA
jgi:UDP:flavonoid glycosyltransferase YjiC (YdhE family)